MKTNYETLRIEVRDGVAILTLNNPPVNQLSGHSVRELAEGLREAFADSAIKAVILIGTRRNFIAGEDVTEIRQEVDPGAIVQKAMERHRLLNSIEQAAKPVVSAINGNCFGGGLEFAMATHYRIAAKGIQIGQPEVKMGLIPGGGGTQRLPRLVGLSDALQMIISGETISAAEGARRGALDEVVAADQLLDKALEVCGRFVSGSLNHKASVTRDRKEKLLSSEQKGAVVKSAKESAIKRSKGYLAPFKAIEAIERGFTDNLEADLELEAHLFAECVVSDVAKHLIDIFLDTRAAGRLPRIENIQPGRIGKVGVLGGGVMGSRIANLLISRGLDVILWDINDGAIHKDIGAINKSFAHLIKKGELTSAGLDSLIKEHVVTTTSLESLREVDLVIEAVPENMNIKQDIWKRLEVICDLDVVFGTNTSALPITEMASVLVHPHRLIGLHFFNPAERMELLEIICGKKTSDQTLCTSVAFGRAIGKVPIVVNDGPGFFVSRELTALMGELPFMIGEGVELSRIEDAVVDFGFPMGPATLADWNGLDITYHVGMTFEKSLGERWKNSPLFERIYETGCYGRKTGSGWFDYSGQEPVPNPTVLSTIERFLSEKDRGVKILTYKEIMDRMMARAINEAAYMIQEEICNRPGDMDLAMICGTGFPRYRGGILRHADAWGIRNVYQYLLTSEREHGARFRPCNLIKEMAEQDRAFYAR